MPRGDRSGFDKTELRNWLFGAICAALAVITVVGIQHWVYYDNAATRAANDARQTEKQIATECAFTDSRSKCAREIEQASRAEQRDEYDLYSQQAMALWTSVMGAMGVLGVALSGVGVYLLWQTWSEARYTSDAQREANEISKKQARADLSITGIMVRIEPIRGRTYSVSFDLINTAPSPAKALAMWCHAKWGNARDASDSFTHESGPIPIENVSGGSTKRVLELIECPPLEMFDGRPLDISHCELDIYVAGSDVFGGKVDVSVFAFLIWLTGQDTTSFKPMHIGHPKMRTKPSHSPSQTTPRTESDDNRHHEGG